MGARHSCVACCPAADDCETEVGGGFVVESLSVLDWGPGNEPVGQVFDETLAHLDALDRQLLLFCATSSLAAVRWLLYLGAHIDACDVNGSTCLHVACRSGGLSVVCEVMRHSQLLDAMDVASWTPLHIAAHMGRREAAIRLLRAGASPVWRNARGQTPLDLCMDLSTVEVLRAPPSSRKEERLPCVETSFGGALGSVVEGMPEDDNVGMPLRCEPECFFVNPAAVIPGTGPHRKALLHIAAVIFNMRPSSGLAFAVLSGVCDSYTGAMRLFLQSGGACRTKLGSFLGDPYSLCALIRFSVFDAMPLLHTGVLGALTRACCVLQMPEDLQKIDLLVRSLAHVWWRKHRALAEGTPDGQSPPHVKRDLLRQLEAPPESPQPLSQAAEIAQPELTGLELKQYLAGADALCQLMLSTVLLHWFVHSNGSGDSRGIAFSSWLALNRGIEIGGMDIPEHVQRRIFFAVCKSFRQEMVLSKPGVAVLKTTSTAGVDRPSGTSPRKASAPRHSCVGTAPTPLSSGQPGGALSVCSCMEGWVELLNGVLLCAESAASDGSCEQVAHSSTTQGLAFGGGSSPITLSSGPASGNHSAEPSSTVWASMCSIFLFFATSRGDDASSAPYALVDARNIRVAHVCSEKQVITLQGVPGKGAPEGYQAPLTCVVLLPDGRWQEVALPSLDLKVRTAEDLQAWVASLVQWPANQFVAI